MVNFMNNILLVRSYDTLLWQKSYIHNLPVSIFNIKLYLLSLKIITYSFIFLIEIKIYNKTSHEKNILNLTL